MDIFEDEETISSLIEKGLIERYTLGNKEYIQLTEFGKIVARHLDNDPAKSN